jgi:hypothetical protein
VADSAEDYPAAPGSETPQDNMKNHLMHLFFRQTPPEKIIALHQPFSPLAGVN